MTRSAMILCLLGLIAIQSIAKPVPESKLYFTEYCEYYKYPSQKHEVTTDDGYVLTFFRVQAKHTKTFRQDLQPIFLMHGLLDSSDTFIINEETSALAFVLANRGYDVWLGNNRGNKHSKKHVSLDSKDDQFWDYTFEEMAIFDLPAGFKYIYEQTNQKIIYIGHSEGTAQMHVHLALFPTEQKSVVRQYLKTYIGLGPVAFVGHQNSELIQLLIKSDLDKVLKTLNIQEFMPGDTWLVTDVGRVFCSYFSKLCGDIVGAIVSADVELDNYERYDVLAGHAPAGTSTKNLLYFRQLAINNRFERYDYGKALNLRIYGKPTPPEFDLGKIDIPVYFIAGNEDLLADPVDVNALVAGLTKSPKVWVKFYKAGHCSYMWGREMPFYEDLFQIIEGKQ